MYLIHAGCYFEEDGVADGDNVMEETLAFCGKEENIDKAKESASSELSEDADFVNVYNLDSADDREEALDKLTLLKSYAMQH